MWHARPRTLLLRRRPIHRCGPHRLVRVSRRVRGHLTQRWRAFRRWTTPAVWIRAVSVTLWCAPNATVHGLCEPVRSVRLRWQLLLVAGSGSSTSWCCCVHRSMRSRWMIVVASARCRVVIIALRHALTWRHLVRCGVSMLMPSLMRGAPLAPRGQRRCATPRDSMASVVMRCVAWPMRSATYNVSRCIHRVRVVVMGGVLSQALQRGVTAIGARRCWSTPVWTTIPHERSMRILALSIRVAVCGFWNGFRRDESLVCGADGRGDRDGDRCW